MGELRRRGKIWWIRYYRAGKRHEESSRSAIKDDAKKLLAVREGDIAKGLPITAKVNQLRFDEAVHAVVRDYRINGRRSTDQVERRIRLHLQPFFGGRRMMTIDAGDAARFREQRQSDGASVAEINRELAILKRAFSIAAESGFPYKPTIKLPAENNARQGFLDAQQFAAVCNQLSSDLQPVAVFGFVTGWRRAEILTLEWANIDRTNRVVTLPGTRSKNGKPRSLAYGGNSDLCRILDAQWAAHERLRKADRIVPNVFHRNGKPIRDFKGAWAGACKRAGFPETLFHDMRRSAVKNLVSHGTDRKTAKTITGHVTDSVFDRYLIVTNDDQRKALANLPSLPGPEAAAPARVAAFGTGT